MRLFGSRGTHSAPSPGLGPGPVASPFAAGYGAAFDTGPGPMPSRWGGLLDAWDWDAVRREVADEARARIVIAGPTGAGKATLFNRLCGWRVVPTGAERPAEPENGTIRRDARRADGTAPAPGDTPRNFGTLALVDLPADGTADVDPFGFTAGGPADVDPFAPTVDPAAAWHAVDTADLVLFVLDGTAPVDAAVLAWTGRARATGRPIVVALNKIDHVPGDGATLARDAADRLGCPVVPVSALAGTNVVAGLLPALVAASPRAALALGRSVPAARRLVAAQVMRRAALASLVTGMEPVPLVDIPLHLACHMRLQCRLAALYGRAETTGGAGDLMTSATGALGARVAAQQLVKLVPISGWIASGLLSCITTIALGRAAVARFEGRLPTPRRPRLHRFARRGAAVAPVEGAPVRSVPIDAAPPTAPAATVHPTTVSVATVPAAAPPTTVPAPATPTAAAPSPMEPRHAA